jgi:hypothetical protein
MASPLWLLEESSRPRCFRHQPNGIGSRGLQLRPREFLARNLPFAVAVVLVWAVTGSCSALATLGSSKPAR